MSENLWDAYGKWNDIAGLGNVDDVKRLISGNRMWRSNYVSPPLQYIFNYIVEEAKEAGEAAPVCLDFGCGLGRNAPMLRHFFPQIIGLDLPEMGKRLETEYPQVHGLYARVHTAPEAVKSEEFCVLYDSVVLQHVTNRAYVTELLEIFFEKPAFRTFISVYNNNSSIDTDNPHYPHIQLLRERGWKLWHQEVETVSFEGAPHGVAVYRRP